MPDNPQFLLVERVHGPPGERDALIQLSCEVGQLDMLPRAARLLLLPGADGIPGGRAKVTVASEVLRSAGMAGTGPLSQPQVGGDTVCFRASDPASPGYVIHAELSSVAQRYHRQPSAEDPLWVSAWRGPVAINLGFGSIPAVARQVAAAAPAEESRGEVAAAAYVTRLPLYFHGPADQEVYPVGDGDRLHRPLLDEDHRHARGGERRDIVLEQLRARYGGEVSGRLVE